MSNQQGYTYAYPRPAFTVDAVILTLRDDRPSVLLIQRGADPFAGRWALPGGFVNESESPPAACKRELLEETGLAVGTLYPIGGFGEPGRDPRGWTVSLAYLGVVSSDRSDVCGADDALAAKWRPLAKPGRLAFDHLQILKRTKDFISVEQSRSPLLAPLVGKTFLFPNLYKIMQEFDPALAPPARVRRELLAKGLIRPAEQGAAQAAANNRNLLTWSKMPK